MRIQIRVRGGIVYYIFDRAYDLFRWRDEVPGFDEVCLTQTEWDRGMY